jgi:hypothetical protein
MTGLEDAAIFGQALSAAKDYADTVVKGPLSEFGGILTDTVGYWRLKNRVRLLLKAKQWLQDQGINPKKLLPDIFVPLLEDGGNVEDETLADMFASLLTCHLDPKQQELIHPSYTKVLSQLSSLDAKAMLIFRKWVSYQGAREVGLRGPSILVEEVSKELNLSNRTAYLSCLNLNRLGIIEHDGYSPPNEHPMPNLFEDSPEHQKFRITEYGVAFCDACQYREQQKSSP